jgi:hypothetical protein
MFVLHNPESANHDDPDAELAKLISERWETVGEPNEDQSGAGAALCRP